MPTSAKALDLTLGLEHMVAVVDIDGDAAKKKARELGAGKDGFACDLSDPDTVTPSVAEIVNTFGRSTSSSTVPASPSSLQPRS
jgi:hypothetical protein